VRGEQEERDQHVFALQRQDPAPRSDSPPPAELRIVEERSRDWVPFGPAVVGEAEALLQPRPIGRIAVGAEKTCGPLISASESHVRAASSADEGRNGNEVKNAFTGAPLLAALRIVLS